MLWFLLRTKLAIFFNFWKKERKKIRKNEGRKNCKGEKEIATKWIGKSNFFKRRTRESLRWQPTECTCLSLKWMLTFQSSNKHILQPPLFLLARREKIIGHHNHSFILKWRSERITNGHACTPFDLPLLFWQAGPVSHQSEKARVNWRLLANLRRTCKSKGGLFRFMC